MPKRTIKDFNTGPSPNPAGQPRYNLKRATNGVLDDDFVNAYLKSRGSTNGTLRELGLSVKQSGSIRKRKFTEMLERPGVQARMEKMIGDFNARRAEMQEEIINQCLHGESGAVRVSAFMAAARVAGWLAPTKVQAQTENLNIHTLLNRPEVISMLEGMTHEPGQAQLVSSSEEEE